MAGALHSPKYKLFRESILQLRKDAGVSQAELSARLGRPQSFVSKYESGERRLDVVEFLEVCEALKADPKLIISSLLKGGVK
jgi:transcriptional regulator with XRE-family HTH domain